MQHKRKKDNLVQIRFSNLMSYLPLSLIDFIA